MAARLRFLAFCAVVLGLPAVVWSSGDPRLSDPGKLVLILSPALAGLALNPGLGRRAGPRRWSWVGWSALITLGVAGLSLAAALAFGASRFGGSTFLPQSAGAAILGTLATSVLEELGWAGGGLGLAVKAFGRRWGVLILGLVWAAWHLVPTFLKIGLFPDLEAGSPLMLATFVAACLAYRELLTRLAERSGAWLGAAAGHAAPNVALTSLMVLSGLVVLDRPEAWPLFPAPGGVVFVAAALVAVVVLRRKA